MIYAGYVKVAPGKPQTSRAKLKISPGAWEAKFSLCEGQKSSGSGFTGSEKLQGVFVYLANYLLSSKLLAGARSQATARKV